MERPRTCRECGIDYISPGTSIEGHLLCWAEDDLCSLCQDNLQAALERDAARYRFLRNRQARTVDIAAGGVFAGQPAGSSVLNGEHLDRAIDAEMGADIPHDAPLEERLAACLAEAIDAPLLQGRDECGGFSSPLDIRLGFFQPDIANRAAELLEEAGQ